MTKKEEREQQRQRYYEVIEAMAEELQDIHTRMVQMREDMAALDVLDLLEEVNDKNPGIQIVGYNG